MIKTAILCSGQGAQSSGMFALLADAPAAEPVFQAANRILDGVDPRDLVHRSTSEAIHADKIGQILCCTQAMAAWAVIGGVVPRPLMVAGYSVGELAAWGVAGFLAASDVLGLALERAAVMDAATTLPSGLAAIRGLSRGQLEPICEAHGCFIAIVNAADQMLVGGTQSSLSAVVDEATAAGAERTTMLPVAVASHTPLLTTASTSFARTLASAPIRSVEAGTRLLSGIDGAAVFNIANGLAKLARQIQSTVDWAACMDACRAAGISKVVELGPGAALARIARDSIPGVDAHSLSEFHTLSGFTAWAR